MQQALKLHKLNSMPLTIIVELTAEYTFTKATQIFMNNINSRAAAGHKHKIDVPQRT